MARPNYGLDAPAIIVRSAAIGTLLLGGAFVAMPSLPPAWWSRVVVSLLFASGFSFAFPAVTITLGSLFFKFRDREWLLDAVALGGGERVLDVGCGHGLLLVGAAKRLSRGGRAVGLDRWVQADQAANSRDATLRNAALEGVAERVTVVDGDMRALPFCDGSFDVVVSSWAIHNIYDRAERHKALAEIVRVLAPGGRVAILDIDHAREYERAFADAGLAAVERRGPRFTFGNRTYLVLAKKA